MTTALHPVPDSLLSVRGAADWLKRHGVAGATRHAVLVAIASGKMPLAATTQRQMLVRETDLERYADQQKAASHR